MCSLVLCNRRNHNLRLFFFVFLVKFILVIHVSYYITLYLNDVVNSCVRFGHTVCVRTEEM